MSLSINQYAEMLIKQIGFEKQAFDGEVHRALTISLGAASLCLGLFSQAYAAQAAAGDGVKTPILSPSRYYDFAFVASGLAFATILAMFVRAIRAYRNYYGYMLLKNELCNKTLSGMGLSKSQMELACRVDLRRSLEGRRIVDRSRWSLARRLLYRTEFGLLLVGLFGIQVAAGVKGVLLLSVWGGYVVLVEIVVLFAVIHGLFPDDTCENGESSSYEPYCKESVNVIVMPVPGKIMTTGSQATGCDVEQ